MCAPLTIVGVATNVATGPSTVTEYVEQVTDCAVRAHPQRRDPRELALVSSTPTSPGVIITNEKRWGAQKVATRWNMPRSVEGWPEKGFDDRGT